MPLLPPFPRQGLLLLLLFLIRLATPSPLTPLPLPPPSTSPRCLPPGSKARAPPSRCPPTASSPLRRSSSRPTRASPRARRTSLPVRRENVFFRVFSFGGRQTRRKKTQPLLAFSFLKTTRQTSRRLPLRVPRHLPPERQVRDKRKSRERVVITEALLSLFFSLTQNLNKLGLSLPLSAPNRYLAAVRSFQLRSAVPNLDAHPYDWRVDKYEPNRVGLGFFSRDFFLEIFFSRDFFRGNAGGGERKNSLFFSLSPPAQKQVWFTTRVSATHAKDLKFGNVTLRASGKTVQGAPEVNEERERENVFLFFTGEREKTRRSSENSDIFYLGQFLRLQFGWKMRLLHRRIRSGQTRWKHQGPRRCVWYNGSAWGASTGDARIQRRELHRPPRRLF